jgi:MarR family transcriptional regulator, temperature-dependent positive regulator of motility|tara:strand:+ start:21 stop:326 length:306 start_codon:yes stop_codon:yes gene_type:complete
MLDKSDYLNILRQIKYSSKLTQRELATKLGFSLGKLNYCLKELQKKGLIKISNFEKNQNKLRYLYILTPKGMTQKTRLTIRFMKLKMKEYDELKKDLKNEK